MIRLGLIGVGAWGQHYVQTIAKRADCRIVAYSGKSSQTDFSIPGAVVCDPWQSLLQPVLSDPIDGLIVATTPDNQAEVAGAALLAGIPCLVEKPLGLSEQSVQGVLDCLNRSHYKPPLVVDYIHLFSPAFRTLKDLVLQGSGTGQEITQVETAGFNRGPYRSFSSLYDYGVHEISMVLGLLGHEAPYVLGDARRNPGISGQGELFEANFEFGRTKVRTQFGNGAASKCRKLTVTLTDGQQVVYDDCEPHPFKLKNAGRALPVDETAPLDLVVSHFLQCCERHGTLRDGSQEAAKNLQFSLRIAEILDGIELFVQRAQQ
jgi:predicted dehydrogenase